MSGKPASVGGDGLLTGLFWPGLVLLLALPTGVPLVARDLESGALRLSGAVAAGCAVRLGRGVTGG
ncbi:hypothetical protein ABZ747_10105 [Kitasatospora cineracea]|uniref:hypothetical protein n=1 Tax=Kitasatospora cineracea TaxID=88074 RepID=UPI00340FA9CC